MIFLSVHSVRAKNYRVVVDHEAHRAGDLVGVQ
jgi:hypothetical protein